MLAVISSIDQRLKFINTEDVLAKKLTQKLLSDIAQYQEKFKRVITQLHDMSV